MAFFGLDEPVPEPVAWKTRTDFPGWHGFFWGLCGWFFLYTPGQMASLESQDSHRKASNRPPKALSGIGRPACAKVAL